MVRDDLLEQIRQPFLHRVDKRLALILAVSLGAHVAIAIAAWLGDLPEHRALVETGTVATYLDDDVLAITPPRAAEPAPGVAYPPPSHAPLTPRRRARSHDAPVNPSALISDMVGDDPGFVASGRRSLGKDLEDQLREARERQRMAKVGGDGDEEVPGIGDGTQPALDGPDGPTRTVKGPEHAPPPRVVRQPPPPGVDFDPTEDIQRYRMRAIQRCYVDELRQEGTLQGRVQLGFTIGRDGDVTAAQADGLAGVSGCIARLARGWRFSVALPRPVAFRLTLIFTPH